MYSVTKRIDFCYGHRLLDYDGICKHPHGHNAVAEIEVRTGTLDNRNMVCDFSDIKRVVKGWIDRELDHKMILRARRPAGGAAPAARRAGLHRRQQSHRRAHREAASSTHARRRGFPVVRVTVWETPTSFADRTYGESMQR